MIILLITTSVFSSTYFYNNLSLTLHSYFNATLPFSFLQTLLFLFWISLIASLNLFIFLILLFLKILTFDWFLIESIFGFLLSISPIKTTFFLALIWLNFLSCLFIKCGIAPFFFWKPIFFKGMSLPTLMFYVTFFYFFLFLFLLYFFLIYLNDIFFFNIFFNMFLIITGTFVLLFVLLESYYLKTFLALSSIINTILIFFAATVFNFTDLVILL